MPRKKTPILPFSGYMMHWTTRNDRAWDSQRGKGSTIEGEVDVVANIPLFDHVAVGSPCPYCGTALYHEEDFEWPHHPEPGGGVVEAARAQRCPHCQWWVCQYKYRNWFLAYAYERFTTAQGIVYEFDLSKYGEPIGALRKMVEAEIVSLQTIDPRDLELLVASVFRDLRQCKVVHIGGPGDGGVDLLLVESDEPCLVQVKRRLAKDRKESVSVVRQVLGSMLLTGLRRGIIVSTAPDFSDPAKEAAMKARHICGFDVSLYNQDRLRDALCLTSPPEKPWRQYIPRESVDGEVSVYPGGKPKSQGPLCGGHWW